MVAIMNLNVVDSFYEEPDSDNDVSSLASIPKSPTLTSINQLLNDLQLTIKSFTIKAIPIGPMSMSIINALFVDSLIDSKATTTSSTLLSLT